MQWFVTKEGQTKNPSTESPYKETCAQEWTETIKVSLKAVSTICNTCEHNVRSSNAEATPNATLCTLHVAT